MHPDVNILKDLFSPSICVTFVQIDAHFSLTVAFHLKFRLVLKNLIFRTKMFQVNTKDVERGQLSTLNQ